MNKNSKIYVAGHRGLVGSALRRQLNKQGYHNIVTRTHKELDLIDTQAVTEFFDLEKPDVVFVAAARVGGIHANNTYPAEFIYQNLCIQNNLIHQAYTHGVQELLYLGSACIYPKFCEQPMREEYLLTGSLEPTNEPYAIAKIAGLKMCESYNRQYGTRFIMPMATNLYGMNDNFHLENSHVIPGMMRRFHEAKLNKDSSVMLWGTGTPRREFLYSDDLADACIFLINNYHGKAHINVGSGVDQTIRELALEIQAVVEYKGELKFDSSKPDGMMRKILHAEQIQKMGWHSTTSLHDGLKKMYEWYKFENKD